MFRFRRIVIVFCVLASALSCLAQEKSATDTPRVYSSPREVFDAYEKACREHDWRTAYYCTTPERRDNFVFEAFFACAMHQEKPAMQALLKKFVTNADAAGAEYAKRYR